MGNQPFWVRFREWIGGIGFDVFLWSIRMSEAEYLDTIVTEGGLTSRALDTANVCRVINHFYVEGVCSQCGSIEPPRQ